MRQALITASDRFEIVEAPVPRLQSDGELLVRTAACGICSGDLMPWYLEKKIGSVLGHEVAGWAAEVGKDVAHIRPGDLVFLHHHVPCFDCPECRRGAFVHCPTWRSGRLEPGGMAEWIRVPTENVRGDTFAVNDLTVEQAIFIEPLGCCVKSLRRLPRVEGAVGVVVGCGVMGLLHLAAAQAMGAAELHAVEPDPARRRGASSFGAITAYTPGEAEQALARKADFAVIGPGHPDVIRQALAYVRSNGVALLFTPTPTGVTTPVDFGDLYFREVSLIPSYSCGPEDTRLAYDLLRRGKIPTKKLVTHRFALEDIQRAHDTARGGGSALKVLVTFE